MKKIGKNRKLVLIIIFIIGILMVTVLWLTSSGSSLFQENDNGTSRIQANKGDTSLTVSRDGRVEYRDGDRTFTDFWNADRTRAFFAYYDEVYADGATVEGSRANFTYDDDELLDQITKETGGNGNNDDEDDGGFSEYFNTPNPSGGGSQSTNTPAPTTNPQEQPWCLYWRLSYCVIAYTPPPTGTPVAGENIRQPDCDENLDTGKTTIGDEQCFTPVTPTPLPN